MPTVGLSMIVRDAADTLAPCLRSASLAVDEMVLADTGSRDSTIQLAESLGAKVISILWEDDFALARNRALEALHTDWVLILDADELLDSGAAQEIRTITSAARFDAFQVTIRNYVHSPNQRIWNRSAHPNDSTLPEARSYAAYIDHQNVRLFRRDPQIYFEGCIHETVGWRIRSTGRKLGQAPFLIHHFGMAAAESPESHRKTLYYRELSRKKVAQMPQNAQAHLELAILELDYFRDNSSALRSLDQACHLDPQLGAAWFFAGVARLRLGIFGSAIRCFETADKLLENSVECAELRGDAQYNSGRYVDACRSYVRALQRARSSPSLASKLGLAEVRAGLVSEGLDHLRSAIHEAPHDRALHDRLIAALILLGHVNDAAGAAEHKLSTTDATPEDFMKAAAICAKLKQLPRAKNILLLAISKFPSNTQLPRALQELEHVALTQPTALDSVLLDVQKK